MNRNNRSVSEDQMVTDFAKKCATGSLEQRPRDRPISGPVLSLAGRSSDPIGHWV